MKKVRLALIGTGRWGTVIAKTLTHIPECELAYEITHKWRALLTRDDIDGVIITTPPRTHAEIAEAFMRRGVPVFIEKPMTCSLPEARRIARAAKARNVLVGVGHVHLYNPAFQEAKRLAAKVGGIHLLIGEGANAGPIRSDYSAMWDWAPHDIAMMLAVVGKMPTQVQAWGTSILRPGTTVYDATCIKLTFPSGITGFILSSWLMPQKCKRFTIVGSKRSIVYDDVLTKRKVSLYNNTNSDVSYPAYDSAAPLTREMRAFIKAILGKEKLLSGIKEGLAVVEILSAAERSIKNAGKAQGMKRD